MLRFLLPKMRGLLNHVLDLAGLSLEQFGTNHDLYLHKTLPLHYFRDDTIESVMLRIALVNGFFLQDWEELGLHLKVML